MNLFTNLNQMITIFLTKAYKKIIKPAVNFATKHQDIIGDTVKCASPVVQHAFNKFQGQRTHPNSIGDYIYDGAPVFEEFDHDYSNGHYQEPGMLPEIPSFSKIKQPTNWLPWLPRGRK